MLLERFLEGEEVSVMALCDGERALLLPAARDFKRARDGDEGPNTGGMGAYAPALAVDEGTAARIRESVVAPVLAVMRGRGIAFRGVLYCGLMITPSGLSVVEFNVRFGDPETQVILPRVGGSLFRLLEAASRGALEGVSLETRPGASVAVALVADEYPESSTGEGVISDTGKLDGEAHTWMIYAAVRATPAGWGLAGGRSAYVCAEDTTLEGARRRAYAGIARLGGTGWRFRHDIATMAPALRGR
jgi:phosphoribosylamine--glycine ligase